ncbi:MAG: ABC transporter substrate-binding protein [Acidimicrobiaceae bacterium]|nr:ABC transporter substrate-binding protein [Acidimicrobiaceae bacterium]|tara:strand:+ start:203 stop:1174 length:972 start_codon:yes stop_codon:yes gene_type:complete
MKNRNKFVALIATLALVIPLASCSTNSSQIEANGERSDAQTAMQIDSEVAQSVYPLVVETINGDISIEDRPTKILSLSPTATEILFAVGAGDQVIAVDDQSNYPAEAPTSGISGYAPNLEAILALEPDLVVHSYLPEDIEQGLANVGIPSLPQFAAQTLEDTYQQIEQLGLVTDNSDSALAQVQSMRDSVDQLVARTSNLDSFSFFHELDQTYYSVTSATFIGQVYDMLGLQNIADAAEGAGSGYPQLSEEYILSQDPDLIFLADTKCCAQSIETVSERNGWNALTAVQSQKIIELDDDIASRWGPRVVEFLEAIVVAIEQIG